MPRPPLPPCLRLIAVFVLIAHRLEAEMTQVALHRPSTEVGIINLRGGAGEDLRLDAYGPRVCLLGHLGHE